MIQYRLITRVIAVRRMTAMLLNPLHLEDINKLAGSVDKGNITTIVKVHERIGRLKQKYPSIAKHYDVNVETNNDKASRVIWAKKASRDERAVLTGCYVIETTHQDLSASEIWRLYTMLTRVEDAFRSLKTDLGIRPVYHQLGERTMSHLFISVLAYHLLICIEQKLLENGDHVAGPQFAKRFQPTGVVRL